MIETLPDMRARHRQEVRGAVEALAQQRVTQSEAAQALGTTLQNINNIIRREGIFWPVKRQGQRNSGEK